MKIKAGLLLLLMVLATLCSWPLLRKTLTGKEALALLPLPQKMEQHKDHFTLAPDTELVTDNASCASAEYLADRLRPSTGYRIPILSGSSSSSRLQPAIVLCNAGAESTLGPEGYQLVVSPDLVSLRAASPAGMFYGVQTLLQLLPPEIFSSHVIPVAKWKLPCVQIQDKPRFEWRGLMLDVSRHFFDKEEVKKLLDGMALQKLNTFHWHLTDDQGWRIEIKKYPLLTQIGSWRKRIGFNLDPKSSHAYGPDGRYGGYYTQRDVREIIAYAQSRHITIVPEIEMPSHATAALAAYPGLSCFGEHYSTDAEENTSAGVFCAGKEQTFDFLQNVLEEVIELFPGKYIHIGGDEVPKQNWKDCPRCQGRIHTEGLNTEQELQRYFIGRIEKFIAAHERTMIGWSEIREGGLPPGAAIMDWIGGAVEAASSGHDVVMSPLAYCYFDFYQSKARASEPPAIGAFLPLDKVYSFEPLPSSFASPFQPHILGAQGNVWTEYMPSLNQVEYMTFPRLCALAEVVWSPRPCRNWQDFGRRLPTHLLRLDRLGINYRQPFGMSRSASK